MKKRLFLLIFSTIFVTAITISFVIGSFSRNFVRGVFRENKEEKISRIESQLEHYQSILHSVEKEMNGIGEAALFKLYKKYPGTASINRASVSELKRFATQIGVGEVYFIDKDGSIFNSSLQSDVGLDLTGVSPSFSKYIDEIYGKGEVVSQGVNVSINEGKINHYMYYSPPGSSIIYEISIDASAYIKNKYNFELYEFLFRDMFKSFYGNYLHSVDLYSFAGGKGRSLINEGKIFYGSKELISKIINRGESVVEEGDILRVYKRLSFNEFFFNSSSRIYIELVYDISSLRTYSFSVFRLSLISIILITVIMFFLSSRRLNALFVDRINNILDGVRRIKNGTFTAPIDDSGKDELNNIASAINDMAATITKRTDDLGRTNEQLHEVTLYMNSIIESMPSALITLDNDDRILHWNRGAVNFTGISTEKARGNNLWELLPFIGRFKQACQDVRVSRNLAAFSGESVTVDKPRVVNLVILPFRESEVSGIIIRIDDITEIEKKEAQLKRARKAEMLGTMAGGLAHDFNNIISGIVSTASFMNYSLDNSNGVNPGEISEGLDMIKKSGLKASGLVKKLLSFSNRDLAVFEQTDISALIRDAVELSGHMLADIEVNLKLPEGEALAMADRSQLEQVFLNLIVNAAEAISSSQVERKGLIEILLEKGGRDLPKGDLQGEWHVVISDNGPGISQDILGSVFDPFVSTKESGSGLGLAIVNTIITEHEGFIEVSSGRNGTRFDIYIPSADF